MKSLILLAGLCALVFPSLQAHGQLVISEVMPKNEEGIKDEDGDRPDWLELHNQGSEAIALDAYAITDSAEGLAGWQLPKRTLNGGEFLIVFASGKDRRGESDAPHANFKLEAKGEYLAVVRIADEKIIHAYDPKFPKVRKGQSCGLRFDRDKVLTDSVVLFDTPTPGARNDDSVAKPKVADTKFSVDRGFFDAPFEVALSTKTPGASIHYTLDGTPPSEDHGTLYGDPIAVESTTVLRVMAFKDGHEATNIDTATYIFPAKVIAQPAKPEGWPSHYAASRRGSFFRFGGGGGREVAVDYAMSPPEATGATAAEIETALRSIPTLSLVTDQKHFFDKEDGIFQNPDKRGRESERPLSVELIDPSGSEKGFQVNAGVRIRGGHSRRVECQKHGMRLYFRSEYGAGKLDYPLFGDEGVSSFDDIDLRTAQNYSYHYSGEGDQNTMVREVFSRDTQAALGRPYTRSRYYHLYINGLYWGLYQTQEHAEASFGAAYFGGEKEGYDTIKNRSGIGTSVTDGTNEGWIHLWETSAKIAASDSAPLRLRLYRELQGLAPDGTQDPDSIVYLDADNLIDYMLVIFFTGSFDGPITNFASNRIANNWFSIWQRGGRSGFKFFCHDSEHTLGSQRQFAEINRVGPFIAGQTYNQSNPQWIHQQLTAVAEYRERFRARAEETLLGDGPLSLEANLIRLRHRAQEVGRAIPAEIARWGDTRNRGGWKKQDWEEAITYVEEVLEMRAELVLDQLGSAKRYAKGIPSSSLTDAPLFNPVRRPGF